MKDDPEQLLRTVDLREIAELRLASSASPLAFSARMCTEHPKIDGCSVSLLA
jgi:hypothetical protein